MNRTVGLTILVALFLGGVTSTSRAEETRQGLVFEHWRQNTWDLGFADPESGDATHLTNTTKDEAGATFSPDGSRIVFESNDDLFVMKRDGSKVERLTNTGTLDFLAEWSPDGTKIAYSAVPIGTTETHRGGIWTIDVLTKERHRLSSGAKDFAPSWSPNGSMILFHGLRGRDYELLMVDISSGDVERLTNNRADDKGPAWDRDGSSIVYTRSPRNATSDGHLVRQEVATGQKTRLTPSGEHDEIPAISPDGSHIAFHRCGARTCALWVMDSDGSNQRELVSADVEDGFPVWSPDGLRIAFSYLNSRRRLDISIVDVNSAEVSAVTTLPGDESVTDWG